MRARTLFRLPSRWVVGMSLAFNIAVAGEAQDFDRSTHTAASAQTAVRALANEALAARDYVRAIKLLTPLAVANPKDAEVLYDLGSAEDALDQTTASEASYRAAIQADPGSLEPHLALGLLLARAGRMEQARGELVAATAAPKRDGVQVVMDPTDNSQHDDFLRARAFRALARVDERDRPDDAGEELLAAVKLSPETPEDTLLTAELAARSSEGAAPAQAALRRLLALHANDPQASAALARLLVEHKREPEAEALLVSALEANPDDPVLTTQLATLLNSAGKSAEALALVEKLHGSAAYAGDPNIARLLAHLYAQTGDLACAEPLYAALSAQTPRDVMLLDARGDVLIHLERFADAQQALLRAVAQPKLYPTPAEWGESAGRLAFAASENNDPAAALQALALRATVLPPSAMTLFLEAISEDKLHHVRFAQQAYRKFLQASSGAFPDQEFEAQHRLVALEHMK